MLTEKVTCVLINTPNNPTGVVYSADTLTRMAAILTEKSAQYGHNIFLVSDEPRAGGGEDVFLRIGQAEGLGQMRRHSGAEARTGFAI